MSTSEALSYTSWTNLLVSKFLLEVLGAAGAIWGAAEAYGLRKPHNNEDFRKLSLLTGFLFAVRFYFHMKHWWEHARDYLPAKQHHRRTHWTSFVQVFGATFILQVLGAAGAVWGASEAMGWRRPENQLAWQRAAQVTGAVSFLRWCCTVARYCLFCQKGSQGSAGWTIMTRLLAWNEAIVVAFLLEVAGAVGAVWGPAEVLHWRTPETATLWRWISGIVGLIFLLRWLVLLWYFDPTQAQSALIVEETDPVKASVISAAARLEHEAHELERMNKDHNDLALVESVMADVEEKKSDSLGENEGPPGATAGVDHTPIAYSIETSDVPIPLHSPLTARKRTEELQPFDENDQPQV